MDDVIPLNISFPPISGKDALILILGSMPSVKSLEQQQYYAHPRNAFWPIMSALLSITEELDYKECCAQLVNNQVAVWDVVRACQRKGSLDQHIESNSMIANDFNLFFQQHPEIQQIFFNGTKAEQVFNRHVLPSLNERQLSIARLRLPSTSPAHAAMTFEQKLSIWRHEITNYK